MTQLTSNQNGVLAAASSTRLADLVQLTKVRITMMVVITTYIGFALSGVGSGLLLAVTLIGTALSCMGAAALNQFAERDVDALMPRTQSRPLPAGRVTPQVALVTGLALSVLGVAILAVGANVLTASLSAFTILSYILFYTPLKRVTSVSTIVGAVPGALPPVMGYAAATGRVDAPAVLMFAIMFLWQLPHFLAIAWLYRKDYAAANMPMLPVVDPSGASTFRQMILGCVVLLPLGLMPTMMGVCGEAYFVVAMIAGLVFLLSACQLMITRTRRHARLAFFVSLIYLPVVLGMMLLDRV